MKFVAILSFAAMALGLPAKKEDAEVQGNMTTMATDAPFGIKKGLAYNDGNIINILSRQNSATWAYNWGAALNAPRFQGIPMCWGAGRECDVNGIQEKINRGDTPWVLGYNEPDMLRGEGGCHLTPQQAYDAWGNDMFKFQQRGTRLVCPGISSYDTQRSMFTGYESGLTWLRKFAHTRNTPNEFRCDAQNLHWYGVEGRNGADQARLFIEYINYAHGVVNDIFRREMDIWVTEFSPLPVGDAQIMADLLYVAIPWLNQQPWVARYSPYMAEHLVSNGALNQAGRMFVDRM